ncbi:MAG TPA: CBS domain-containing protein [Acidimicrobiia bacterium]|nr:CBS domain-containing protein [Acidimicrobiia bacterium]
MTVRELIGGEIAWIEPSATLREAARRMYLSDIGALAVESDGELRGIFTERDLIRAFVLCREPEVEQLEDWMTPYPDSFGPEISVETAATWLLAAGYRHLPVVDGPSAIGMISINDILWALTEPTLA